MSSLVLLGKGRLIHFLLSSLNCTHHLLKGSHDLGISVVAVRLLHEDALSLFCLMELFLQRLDGSSLSWNSLARAPLDCLCARAIKGKRNSATSEGGEYSVMIVIFNAMSNACTDFRWWVGSWFGEAGAAVKWYKVTFAGFAGCVCGVCLRLVVTVFQMGRGWVLGAYLEFRQLDILGEGLGVLETLDNDCDVLEKFVCRVLCDGWQHVGWVRLLLNLGQGEAVQGRIWPTLHGTPVLENHLKLSLEL